MVVESAFALKDTTPRFQWALGWGRTFVTVYHQPAGWVAPAGSGGVRHPRGPFACFLEISQPKHTGTERCFLSLVNLIRGRLVRGRRAAERFPASEIFSSSAGMAYFDPTGFGLSTSRSGHGRFLSRKRGTPPPRLRHYGRFECV